MFSLLLSNFKLVGSFCWWGQEKTVKPESASVCLGMLLLLLYMYRIYIERSTEGVYHSENGNHRAINYSGLLYPDTHNSVASILNCTQGSTVHQSLCPFVQFWIIVYLCFSDFLWETNFFRFSLEYFPLIHMPFLPWSWLLQNDKNIQIYSVYELEYL